MGFIIYAVIVVLCIILFVKAVRFLIILIPRVLRGIKKFFIKVINVVLTGLFLVLSLFLILPYMFFFWISQAFRKAKQGAQYIDRNHEQISENASIIAKLSRIVAGVGGLWAWLSAPSGLAAIGASLGIASPPLIVALSPVLIALAGAAYTISAALDLYTKWREKRKPSAN